MTDLRGVFIRVLTLPEGVTLKQFARLWAFTFGLLVFHARAGVLFHEFGHAVAALVTGGQVRGISITLFGGGFTAISGPFSDLFEIAGILVNGILGVAFAVAAVYVLKKNGPRWVAHALAIGAVVNLAGATHYAALSSFYGFGDVAEWPRLWVGALVVFGTGMPTALVIWSRTAAPLVRCRSRTGVAGLLVASVPLTLYGACLFAEQAVSREHTQFVALRAEEVAVERETERLRKRKLAEWYGEHGLQPPPPEVMAVSPDEVRRPFPLTVTMLALDAVFLLAALLLRWPGRDTEVDEDEPRVPWGGALIAGSGALFIAYLIF